MIWRKSFHTFCRIGNSNRCSCFLNGVLVIKYGMEKLITTASFILVVSATYIFIIHKIRCSCFVVVFLQFFSIGFLLVIYVLAMEPVGHIADCRSGYWLSTIMAVPISFHWPFYCRCFAIICWLFDMCIISRITYLFKIDEKRVNITSKTEFDWVSRL
jgi:DHA1 family bicyclomycin/chloramphenicol resistance-like MFS transporter